MAAKFELFKDKGGDFRFHLKAANGEIIASGQGYKSKATAEKGIESIKTNAPAAAVIDNTAQHDQLQSLTPWVLLTLLPTRCRIIVGRLRYVGERSGPCRQRCLRTSGLNASRLLPQGARRPASGTRSGASQSPPDAG
jgi:uncharacterized protein